MKTLIQRAITFALTAISLSAHAGREGNGGDVVFCENPQEVLKRYPELGAYVPGSPFVGLLDVVEGRVLRNYVMDLGSAPLPDSHRTTLKELMPKIEIVLGRIKKFDPRREKLYRGWAETFFEEAKIDQIELVDIPDSNHKGVPVGCTPKQLIIHEEPQFDDEPRYIINSVYWDRMDANHQVAAMFHEFAYREGISLGHVDSRPARYYNSNVLSSKFSQMTMASYIKLIKQTKLIGGTEGIAWVNGEEYYVEATEPEALRVELNGRVTLGFPTQPKSFQLGNLSVVHRARARFVIDSEGTRVALAHDVLAHIGKTRVRLSNELHYETLIVDSQNRILKAHLSGYNRLPTAYGPLEFIGEIVARPNGTPEAGYVWWNGGQATMADGSREDIKKGLNRVLLDEQGRFTGVRFWTDERVK